MTALRTRVEVAALQALLSGLGGLMALASLKVERLRRQITRDLVIEIRSDDGARQQYRLHATTRRLTLARAAEAGCTLHFSAARAGLRALVSRRTIGRVVEGMNASDTRIDGNPVLLLWFHGLTRVVAHMTFWAAIDALVTIGEDPNVDRYPPEWQIYMPERLRGAYTPPGWIGNGDERWGLNPDPIAADGNVFFRGFFNLLLSVYAHVSGDKRYHEPFQVSGYLDRQFTWTQPELAQFISDQLADRPEGIHCENTKIWPFCVSATGLGLKAYDAVNGTRLRDPYDAWSEFAQRHYMGRDRRGDLEWFAFYYDPIVQEACSFPDHVTALGALVTLPYIYPQRPDWGLWLYEQCVHKLGWSNAKAKLNEFIPDPRGISIALLIAHEVGDDVTETRLREHVEQHWEPRFFGSEQDRFGFFFGWDEEFPRGQHSALLMIPEVGGRGSWKRWSDDANLAKFEEPTVEGVDYPSIGLSTARNDLDRGELQIGTYAATPSHGGRDTTFRVTKLPDPARVRVTCDGEAFTAWRTVSADAIELELSIGGHDLVVFTGHHGPGAAGPATTEERKRPATPASSVNIGAAAPSPKALAAAARSCRCC